mgnify:CR=1 FL=1
MIKIYCLYYEGKYTTDYISRLYRGLKRNSKVDFKFICLSDSDVEADEVIPLEKESIIAEHWHKLRFFDKEFTGEGDIVVMDIDQIIISDITDMIGWPVQENELVSLGGQAAAAAHSLGTPLSTIKIISQDLYNNFKNNKAVSYTHLTLPTKA